jgi:hypothetical protein
MFASHREQHLYFRSPDVVVEGSAKGAPFGCFGNTLRPRQA